jgi:hypothetical protein
MSEFYDIREARAEIEQLRSALAHIHDTFVRDIKQGYVTRDKEFAVSIAAQALRVTDQPDPARLAAVREVARLGQEMELPDQPAAIPCPHPDVAVVAGKCYCCGESIADQQALSMQDAPQPVEGTGKQSMQACTTEKQTLVQPTRTFCVKWQCYTPVAGCECLPCVLARDGASDKSSDTPARGLHFDED